MVLTGKLVKMPINHTVTATGPNDPSKQVSVNAWNASHTSPDIADVTGLTAGLAAKQATLVSGTNIKTINGASLLGSGDFELYGGLRSTLTPADFGCKGEYEARSQGIWDGTYFSDTYFKFEAKHVGWSFWQDGNARTITAVTLDGKATLSPAGYGTNNINWRMMGQNDTVFFQNFLDALSPDYDAGNPSNTFDEPVIPLNGTLKFGKVGLLTPGVSYPVSNSSAQFSGGKLSALIVRRRTAVTCLSDSEHGANIVLMPGSYGSVLGNKSTSSFTDFVTLSNFTIVCDGDYSTNSLYGLHFQNPYGDYAKTDPYVRFKNLRVERARLHGYFIKGKGEIKIRDCDAFNCSGYGMFITGQFDCSLIGGQFGGCGLTGLRVDSPGPIQITGIKSFFNGSAGGSNDEDCANLVVENLTGDFHAGGAFMSNVQCQESRGCGIVIKIRSCVTSNLQIQDPNRSAVGGPSGRPTVKAGIYLKGPIACGNHIHAIVMPALTEYDSPNWPADTSIIHIDGDDPFNSTNGGPQNNTGIIEYPVNYIRPGGSILNGVQFNGSGSAFSGNGCINGKNPNLFLNGVPFSPVVTSAASGDLIRVLDTSDVTSGAGGTWKLISKANLSAIAFGSATVTIPSGRGQFEHQESVATMGIVATDKIMVSLAATDESDANPSEMLSIEAISATAQTGAILYTIAFRERTSGAIKLNYLQGK